MCYDSSMVTTQVENILSVYGKGTFEQIRTGADWYNDAHNLARDIAGDPWRGAGVIAAFSPVTPWQRTEKLARQAFETGIASGHTKTMCAQAQRIIDGEFALDVLNGDKVRAFASAIANPHGSTIATIDRHAHDIAMGRVFADNERKIGKRVFREMSDSYVIAAREIGFSVAQTQAITWVIWREMKGLK
jgi:hypothetical protein